ncbi:MAG: alpha/beta fold hydrolase [Candidatus Omnitrophota bacterium]
MKSLRFLSALWMAMAAVLMLTPNLVFSEESSFRVFEKSFNPKGSGYKYLLYQPKEYEQQENWPLLIILHGAGTRGDNLAKLKKHTPIQYVVRDGKLPFIVAAPLCPARKKWESALLSEFLDELLRRNSIDPDRVYLTGISMGGFGSFQFAKDYPDRLAAVAPVCGGGKPEWAETLRQLPVWAFHGAKDRVVPLRSSENLMKELKRITANEARYTVFPNSGHDIWNKAYNNPELYEWFLSHNKSTNKG